MPDRIIRDELLESEKWLGLSDDTCRLAYIAILLRCDALGNYPADLFRLRRLWRDLQIPSDETASKRISELADHELVQLYDHDGKRYLHIPRFRQRLRYIKRIYPLSPWTTDEEIHTLTKNSLGDSQARAGLSLDSHRALTPEVKRSEVKRSDKKPRARSRPVDKSATTDHNNPTIKTVLQNLTGKSKPESKPMTQAEQLAFATRTKKV